MGFPDLSYLDPDVNGPPVQSNITFYKKFQEDKNNDIKIQRELLI